MSGHDYFKRIAFPERNFPVASRANEVQTILKGVQEGCWCPANRNVLNRWLAVLAAHPISYSCAAIFDFDDTCIFNDIGKAVLRYQLDALLFRFPPETFAILLPSTVGTFNKIPAELVQKELHSLYSRLWPHIAGCEPEKAKIRPEYRQFTTLFLWYVDAARKEPSFGPKYTLSLLAQLFTGYSTEEVEELTGTALKNTLTEPLSSCTRSADFNAPLGTIEIKYQTGIQVFEEMVDLIHCLKQYGIRCYVISASTQWVVQAAAQCFGFPLKNEDIYGIRVQLGRNRVLTTELPRDYPVTYRAGKRWVIENLVSGIPVLVAGDADTDFEMLTLPGVPIRLIINHNKTGLISTLYNDPRYTLQGVDRIKGSFCPLRESLPLQERELFSVKQNIRERKLRVGVL